MAEGLVIAIAGKGGVGKTTTTALMVRNLSEGRKSSLLVVDANPDSNLSDLLGIPVAKNVGIAAMELKKSIDKGEVPPETTKKEILEYTIFDILKETPKFDLLVMGRTEGEGCYCMVNELLTDIIDSFSKKYDLTIMDMEAGLEHLSRRTDRDVDIMLIVTDPSSMGFRTAKRIKELADEVHIQFKKIYLLGVRFEAEMEPMLREEANKIGIEFAGIVPNNPDVSKLNLTGKSLMELPDESPALVAVRDVLKRIGILE